VRRSGETLLGRGRNQRLSFFDDIDHVDFRALVGCALIVKGAVWKGQRLTGLKDVFRFAVRCKPEFTLHDLSHDHARMRMPAGLERWSNLHHRIDQFKVGAGDVGPLKIVRLTGEGCTGAA
jgi:hypothetical protein